jgi:hypothetical protein
MLAAMLTRHFNTTNVYALFCFGHERRLALTALADGVVTIGAGIAFVAAFGLAGGALAAISGALVVSVPLNLRALSAETGIERSKLIASLAPWAIRFTLVAGIAGMSGVLLRPTTFVTLALMGGGAAALYAVAVVTPLLRSPAGVYLQPILASVGRRLTPARLRPRWLG